MPGFHHSVAVLPLPFPPAVAPQPLFRKNRIECYFAVLPQMDNQSAFWSLHPYVYAVRKDVSSNSVLTRNGNGSYGTEERQRNVTTTAPHN